MYHRPRTCLSLLLSAVVLAGGIMPPGLRHAHADADRPHRHHLGSDGHALHADHPHDQDHHVLRHDPDRLELEIDALPDSRLHVHLGWFGFELTLPAPGGPDGGSEREVSPGDERAALIRLVEERVPDPSRTQHWIDDLILALYLPCLGDVPASIQGPFPSPPPISPPLCDAARHERSGVQLT